MHDLFDNGLSIYATAIAVIRFTTAAWLLVKRLRLCFGERAQGEVVAYVERMRSRAASPIMYMPRLKYRTLQHGEQEFVSRMSANPSRWPVGTHLPVAYSAFDPSLAEIATPARLWLAPAIFFLFALMMLGIALRA